MPRASDVRSDVRGPVSNYLPSFGQYFFSCVFLLILIILDFLLRACTLPPRLSASHKAWAEGCGGCHGNAYTADSSPAGCHTALCGFRAPRPPQAGGWRTAVM